MQSSDLENFGRKNGNIQPDPIGSHLPDVQWWVCALQYERGSAVGMF